ncbi:MAG: alginate O-acetyltransferase AlgX-related protein [Christensenellales bacterium]|jgi:hypothetical protein
MTDKASKIYLIANSIICVFVIAIMVIIGVNVAYDKCKELYCAIKAGAYTKEFSSTYEQGLNENFPQKNCFVDINGLAHRLFFQRQMNGVILLKNGQEHELLGTRSSDDILANADSLYQLSEWLNSKGIHFLWCQVPQKLGEEDDQLPLGLKDYANEIADTFLEKLAERKINYLDIRKCIKKDGIDRYSLYLSTEHHWSLKGGFYAFQQICDYLRENLGEDIPDFVTDLDYYNIDTYKSLGYFGQRTGWVFGGFDDFDLIYPKWETKQYSWAPHKKLFREGAFYDAIFYTEHLKMPWRERGLYATYIGGDWPLVVHHSETAPIDKTVMVLIDSYGTIPESFLTTTYKSVVALDLRWILRCDIGKTTVEYVEEYQPDIVIVMFNPNQIGYKDSEQFQFGISEIDSTQLTK